MEGLNLAPIIAGVVSFVIGVLNNRNESRRQQLRAAGVEIECWERVNDLLARNDDLQRQLDAYRSPPQVS